MTENSHFRQYLQATWHKLAISMLFALTAGLIYALPLQAAALPPKPDTGYLEGVVSMYEQVKTAPDSPSNRAFQAVLDQLFKPAAVQIPFRFVSESAGHRSINYAGNIYFSQGALFINYDTTESDELFATVDGQLYSWKPDATEGVILKRFPGDTLAFVMYMIDPSAIMRSIYSTYLEKPNEFTVSTDSSGTKSIIFKQVQNGFKGIRLQENPFWLKAFMLEPSQNEGIDVGNLEVDPPIALDQLPKGLTVLPTTVTFKPTQESLKNRMTYF
ncbi:hypothetical protein IQ266_05730 [filamentous cyanobacterium LEGE 11480]|uniref:Uncharacterized protein n=1 Tax=Romeriopsis navalis LEGE 11480 TaxID=2777977 RepID=A0A928VMJ7_9CYAN|nr:hypothetical protein [Romeriopsis navalis]MBE9029260.1 hypothetical protein [Romeriopsis navalis LEGE 11480]